MHKENMDYSPNFVKIPKRKREVGDNLPKSVVYRTCKKKIRYRTHGEARHAITKCHEQRSTELDYYYCSLCDGYHLTHRIDSDGVRDTKLIENIPS